MLLTGKSVTRTAILECALFELGRKLRGDDKKEPNDLEWREEQFALLTGPEPESCDLWAPLSDRLLQERLLGLVKDRSTTIRALNWLEAQGYVFKRRLGGPRNDRLVLPNIRKINYDQRDLPDYAGVKFKPVVTGSPDQMIEVPEGVILTPLYEGFVQAVHEASGLEGIEVCRSALVFQRILHRAKLRYENGEEVPAEWSTEAIRSTFGWGRPENWRFALSILISSGLVVNHGGNLVEPNLPRVHAICGTVSPLELNVANVQDQCGKCADPMWQTGKSNVANVQDQCGNGADPPFLRETEVFTESLSEFLTERELDPDFKPAEVLVNHSVQQFRERRAAHFAFVDVPDEWSSLSFESLAEADKARAAALLELADKLPNGERPAICFLNNTDLNRALVSVLLGHWIDKHVGDGFRWVNVEDYVKLVGGDFNDARTREMTTVENPSGPLVLENVAAARKHEQARDSLALAIKQHREMLMPVVFLGLPPRLSDLSSSLKGHHLADQIFRVLQERNRPVDHDTGLDISNPFKKLI